MPSGTDGATRRYTHLIRATMFNSKKSSQATSEYRERELGNSGPFTWKRKQGAQFTSCHWRGAGNGGRKQETKRQSKPVCMRFQALSFYYVRVIIPQF